MRDRSNATTCSPSRRAGRCTRRRLDTLGVVRPSHVAAFALLQLVRVLQSAVTVLPYELVCEAAAVVLPRTRVRANPGQVLGLRPSTPQLRSSRSSSAPELREKARGVCVARWYDPGTGQLTSVDPDLAGTDQPYAYAGDDPVNEGDPSGLFPGEPSYCLWGEILCLLTPYRFTNEKQYQALLQSENPDFQPYYRVNLPANTSYSIGYRVYDLYDSETSTALELKVG
jgi:hypothetical protein